MDKITKEIFKKESILLVEDELDVVEPLKQMLNRYFKKVYIASNGLQGVELYKKHHIDIILSDLSMPLMDGVDMVENIKKLDNGVKTIYMTGHNEESMVRDMEKFTKYILLKPINTADLFKAIEEVQNV